MGIKIVLNNTYSTYFAGQSVDGQVIIQNAEPVSVKEITILLDGSGYGYVVRESNSKSSDGESYVSLKVTLAGGKRQPPIELPKGITTYPFHFDLPRNIPSSFKGHLAGVIYHLQAEVNSKSEALKRKTIQFTVIGIVDLNKDPGALRSQEIGMRKDPNLFINRQGTVDLILRLPNRHLYTNTYGEAIDFQVDIKNHSNREIEAMAVALYQSASLVQSGPSHPFTTIDYWAQSRPDNFISYICGTQGLPVDQRGRRIWNGKLDIPPIPPSKLGGECRIVDVQYFLQADANISGFWGGSLSIKMAVIIGSIPLQSTFGNFGPALGTSSGAGPLKSVAELSSNVVDNSGTVPEDVGGMPPANLFPDYPDLPAPPSYAEVVGAEGFSVMNNPRALHDSPDKVGLGAKRDDLQEEAISPKEFVPNGIIYSRKM